MITAYLLNTTPLGEGQRIKSQPAMVQNTKVRFKTKSEGEMQWDTHGGKKMETEDEEALQQLMGWD